MKNKFTLLGLALFCALAVVFTGSPPTMAANNGSTVAKLSSASTVDNPVETNQSNSNEAKTAIFRDDGGAVIILNEASLTDRISNSGFSDARQARQFKDVDSIGGLTTNSNQLILRGAAVAANSKITAVITIADGANNEPNVTNITNENENFRQRSKSGVIVQNFNIIGMVDTPPRLAVSNVSTAKVPTVVANSANTNFRMPQIRAVSVTTA